MVIGEFLYLKVCSLEITPNRYGPFVVDCRFIYPENLNTVISG